MVYYLKYLKLTLFTLLLTFCLNANSTPTNISGILANCKGETLSIEYQSEFLIHQKINTQVSGSNTIEVIVDIEHPVLIKLSNANIRFSAYLYPGSALLFSAEGNSQADLLKSLKFAGAVGEVNNMLWNLDNHTSLKNMNWSTGDQLPLLDLTKKINGFYRFKNNIREEFVSENKSKAIIEILSLDSMTDEYTRASAILTLAKKSSNWADRLKFIHENILPSIFMYPTEATLYIPAVTNFWNYSFLRFLINMDAEKDSNLYKDRGYYLSALTKVDTVFKQPLKDFSRASLLSDLIANPKDFRPGADSLFKLVTKFIKTARLPAETKAVLQEQSQALKNYSFTKLNGTIAPEVQIKTLLGKDVIWKDFKDSVVVVDCWASWCSPCIAQFPYLEMIKKKFLSQKVAFVSISLDEKKENWEKAINMLSLKGNQLLTPGGFKGDFAGKFTINALPRIILIRNGLIVNNEAPLPDDQSLLQEIQNELK